jgi:hypothetical protein
VDYTAFGKRNMGGFTQKRGSFKHEKNQRRIDVRCGLQAIRCCQTERMGKRTMGFVFRV